MQTLTTSCNQALRQSLDFKTLPAQVISLLLRPHKGLINLDDAIPLVNKLWSKISPGCVSCLPISLSYTTKQIHGKSCNFSFSFLPRLELSELQMLRGCRSVYLVMVNVCFTLQERICYKIPQVVFRGTQKEVACPTLGSPNCTNSNGSPITTE